MISLKKFGRAMPLPCRLAIFSVWTAQLEKGPLAGPAPAITIAQLRLWSHQLLARIFVSLQLLNGQGFASYDPFPILEHFILQVFGFARFWTR
jgi:hypothetical protein